LKVLQPLVILEMIVQYIKTVLSSLLSLTLLIIVIEEFWLSSIEVASTL